MLELKGKLKRLDGGMSRHDFWLWVEANALMNFVSYNRTAVRTLCACAHRVKPEFEAEVISFVQMLCESVEVRRGGVNGLYATFQMLDLRALQAYDYGALTLAIQTDRCWVVYPANIRHINNRLTRKRNQYVQS